MQDEHLDSKSLNPSENLMHTNEKGKFIVPTHPAYSFSDNYHKFVSAKTKITNSKV